MAVTELEILDALHAQREARQAVASFQRVLQKTRDEDAQRSRELRAAINDAMAECDRLLEQLSCHA